MARRGRLSGRKDRSAGESFAQPPWRQVKSPYMPVEAVSADELESIHDASLRVLEEIGIDFLLEEARDILKEAGADVSKNSHRVRIDRGLIEQSLKTVRSSFTLHARNSDHNLHMGDNYCAFCTVASAPNASDMDGGRRPGNQQDFQNFVRMGQSLNIIHLFGGYPVEPTDLHASTRHLDCLYDFATLSDKAFHAYSLGAERILDGIEIARIARGVSHDQLDQEPSLFTVINSNSPLKLDEPMLKGIIEMSKRNQVVVLTPFTLAGAMAPVTIAGALTQQNAEALAGLVMTQVVNAGAPFIYGGFTSNVDMKSGAPAFGTPEYMRAALVSGQLARRYGVPFRSSNVNAANSVDAQAAYESVFSLWGALMGHCNMLMHGAGWMEGGLHASFEKMVIDADLLQMAAEFMQPFPVNEEAFGLEAMKEVGPGGHFFGTDHTQSRYQSAFYSPMISDWRNFESWEEAGRPDAYQKANIIYKQMLAEYTPPPIEQAIKDELDTFIAKRKEEGGAPTDF
jgi:trimethylamine---corrinoid protein Co-methyltransferase